MQMHHFSAFYDVFSVAKLQWPHYLLFCKQRRIVDVMVPAAYVACLDYHVGMYE